MKEETNVAWVYVLIFFAMLFWGMSFVFSSIVLRYLDTFTILFIRLLISSTLIWLVAILFFRKYAIRVGDLKMLALLAFFEPFLYFIGETFGLQRVSPTISALIISTIPVFTAITVFFVYKVRLQKINVVGIALSFLGVLFMIIGKNMELTVNTGGLLFLFLAVASAVCYGLVLTKVSAHIHVVWITAVQNTFALLMFLPLMLIFGEPIRQHVTPVYTFIPSGVELWGSLSILAVFCSTLAFLFYTISVKHIGVTRTSIFSNLIPVFTAITSFLLLNESMGLNKVLGMLIVIAGLVLTQWKKKQQPSLFLKTHR
jgi:drug/metabolite transporter (DMT)-like permease